MKTKTKVDYRSYIVSEKWRSNHKPWLKRANNRCSMFPWIRVGRVKSRYHRYEMHHTHYATLGRERFWWDVLPLSPFAHDMIVHGICSDFKSVSEQKTKYPNTAQRLVHLWCRLPHLVKGLLVMAIGFCLILGGATA